MTIKNIFLGAGVFVRDASLDQAQIICNSGDLDVSYN